MKRAISPSRSPVRSPSPPTTSAPAQKRQKGKQPFWTDSIKPTYLFENGLRKVKPYYFEYKTFAKERWYGRTLLDVFRKEFRDRTEAYYRAAIDAGLITVNGERAELEQAVRNGDIICHHIHRHEPPISAKPITILHQSQDMLVVEKPASVPVHPSGRYRFNTLIEILKFEHGFGHLGIINRLDRLTSGVVMLSLDPRTASGLHGQMEAREYRKTYVCRVTGRFPEGETVCEAPLKAVEHKLGLVNVSPEGKESRTEFTRLFYDAKADESVVEARPLTGRTHQIRVHLQALGHPITNDHLYNNPVWEEVEPIYTEPYRAYSDEGLRKIADILLATTFHDELVVPKGIIDSASLCPECESKREEPSADKLCIYLHALRYASDDFDYKTEMPLWAIESIDVEQS